MFSRFLPHFRLAALLAGLFTAAPASAQTYFPVPPANPNAFSLDNYGPNGSAGWHRALFYYRTSDLAQAQLPAASITATSLGFHIQTPAAGAATGQFRLWISATLDPRILRGPDWATLLTTPSPLQKVYDGPLTIPAQAGWFDVVFNQPGASVTIQAGSNYYFAYEWQASTPSAASATYSCNPATSTIIRAAGSTPPLILGVARAFRPWIRFGTNAAISYLDVALLNLYTNGRLPLLAGATAPHRVQALLTNNGTRRVQAGELLVGLTITGPQPFQTAFNTVREVASLAPHDTVRVRFSGWQPTVAGHYTVRVEAYAMADSVGSNNVLEDSIWITPDQLTYAKGYDLARQPSVPVGFGTGSGTLLNRYVASSPISVAAVRLGIGARQYNVGRTVFGIVLDSAGHVLARTPNHIISSGDLGGFIRLALPQPLPAVHGAYFVGLAQPTTAGSAAYYPGMAQPEPYPRDSAYYSAVGDSALTGLRFPAEIKGLGRLVIGAELTPYVLGVPADAAGLPSQLVVWPNPATDALQVLPPADAIGAPRLMDALGREVALPPAELGPDGAWQLAVHNVAPGLYLLSIVTRGGRGVLRTRIIVTR